MVSNHGCDGHTCHTSARIGSLGRSRGACITRRRGVHRTRAHDLILGPRPDLSAPADQIMQESLRDPSASPLRRSSTERQTCG
jgi:hypothetical protein